MAGLVKGMIAVRLNINALQHVAKHMKKGFIMRGIWSEGTKRQQHGT